MTPNYPLEVTDKLGDVREELLLSKNNKRKRILLPP